MTRAPVEGPADAKANVVQETEKVASLITTARRLLAKRKRVELAALEGKVKALCKTIHHLAPEESQHIRLAVAAIVEDLDHLARELTAQHREVFAKTAGGLRRLAMDAYASSKDNT